MDKDKKSCEHLITLWRNVMSKYSKYLQSEWKDILSHLVIMVNWQIVESVWHMSHECTCLKLRVTLWFVLRADYGATPITSVNIHLICKEPWTLHWSILSWIKQIPSWNDDSILKLFQALPCNWRDILPLHLNSVWRSKHPLNLDKQLQHGLAWSMI